jgi:hypothetical protein
LNDADNGPAEGDETGDAPAARAGDGAGAQGAANGEDGPGELLGELSALRRRTRRARHAYWFPLVLFGLLIALSAPFYVNTNASDGVVSAGGPVALPVLGGSGALNGRALGYYWLAALLGGLLLTLLWYRWHARRVGLQTPARGYIVTTATATIVAVVIPLLSLVRVPSWLAWLRYGAELWPGDLVIRGTFPFVIIAVGLCVLARSERSPALGVIAAVFTGSALLSSLYNTENILFRLGWTPTTPGQWSLTALPNVLLPALILLAAGTGAFVVQRRQAAA